VDEVLGTDTLGSVFNGGFRTPQGVPATRQIPIPLTHEETSVTIAPHPSRRRLGRLLAVAAAAVAFGVFASSTAAAAATRHSGAAALSALSSAVDSSAVDGIAWYTDAASGQVVVTADSSVSSAEIATLRRAAGASAGALRIERAKGVFSPLLSAGDAIYGGNYRCSWASTSSAAAPTTS